MWNMDDWMPTTSRRGVAAVHPMSIIPFSLDVIVLFALGPAFIQIADPCLCWCRIGFGSSDIVFTLLPKKIQ